VNQTAQDYQTPTFDQLQKYLEE
jgi:hypothetical protein